MTPPYEKGANVNDYLRSKESDLLYCNYNRIQPERNERTTAMYSMRYVCGHVQVYDNNGKFLFSADSEREAREELMEYAQSAA